MAVTRGCNGKVKVILAASSSNPSVVGELRDWSFTESAERIDSSTMGSCTKSYEAGAQETTGQIVCHWDGDDTQQNLIDVGAAIKVWIYPAGSGSGKEFYKAASATVLSVERAGNGVDGLVGATYSFAVNGAMTVTSVP